MTPFVTKKPAAYLAGTALTTAGIYGSHRMKKDGSRWWWSPIVAQIGMHIVLGIRNSRIN
jgi:hypothetical protein